MYSSAAENIAGGNSTAADVVALWMASTYHRDNILSGTYRELGVGYVHDPSDVAPIRTDNDGNCVPDSTWPSPLYHYWTQNFGIRSAVYPIVIEREAYQTGTRFVDLYLYGSGWANELRIRNENGSWTLWQTFSANVAWELSHGAGTKEVFVEIRQGATVRSASDTIVSTDTYDPGPIFSDGFQSGSTTEWSNAVP